MATSIKKHFSRGDAELAEKKAEASDDFLGEPLMWTLDEITGVIIDESLRIHKNLGPGLLESVYESVLERALQRRCLLVERQKQVRIEYEGMVFEEGFRADMVVEEQVVLEIKSVEKIAPIHYKQLLTYLRLLNLPVGLLLNFGSPTLKEGTKRLVNKLQPPQSPSLRINHPPSSADSYDA